MTRVGLLSDTHGFCDDNLLEALRECDEIWHAGDVGHESVLHKLNALGKIFRGVYGNIDGKDIRIQLDKELLFAVDGCTIWMTHIGGYPGRYARGIREKLEEIRPDVFICGHSHILKVMPDKKLKLLHLNPGAVGKEGFHKARTILRFNIDQGKIRDLEVVEWKR